MKKKIITVVASLGIAVSAMAQGQVSGFAAGQPYVSFGVGQQSGSLAANSAAWFSGSLTMEVLFSSTATAGEAATINGYNGVANGGSLASALLSADGFSQVLSTITGLTANGSANNITGYSSAAYILNSDFAPSTVGYYALVYVGTSGAADGYSDVLAFSGNYGAATPSTPYNIGASGTPYTTFMAGTNIDLTSVAATPEPATMALAGLGIAGLVALRRKK